MKTFTRMIAATAALTTLFVGAGTAVAAASADPTATPVPASAATPDPIAPVAPPAPAAPMAVVMPTPPAPPTPPPPTPGQMGTQSSDSTIQIFISVSPQSGTDFSFSGSSSFVLDDDTGIAGGNSATPDSKTFTVPAFTIVSYQETLPAGYISNALSCTGPGVVKDVNSRTVTFAAPASGVAVKCGFFSVKTATVTVLLDAAPNDVQDFEFQGAGGPNATTTFTLDDDLTATGSDSAHTNKLVITGIIPGTSYEITQLSTPSTWDLRKITCPGQTIGNNKVSIGLGGGQNATCTFTEYKHGSITIVQHTMPKDPQDFVYSVEPMTFTLDDDAILDPTHTDTTWFNDVWPGLGYVFQQHAVPGWSLVDITCNQPQVFDLTNRLLTINLKPGQVVTCTFTNSPRRPDGQVAMSTKGPFAGDNIYAAKVVKAQTKAAKVKKGKSVSLAVKIQNDSSASDTLKVRGITSGATGFNVRYFHGAKDITTLVYLGKYSTGALAPGQNHYITVRFAAQSTAKYLTVRSMNEPTARDVVRVRAARV